jgi:hypothetical protein
MINLFKRVKDYELKLNNFESGYTYFSAGELLLILGMMLTNPFVPDFGLQFGLSAAIGYLMPEKMIDGLYENAVKIPLIGKGVRKFEDKLKNHRRLGNFARRLIAGYVATYTIGGACLVASRFT